MSGVGITGKVCPRLPLASHIAQTRANCMFGPNHSIPSITALDRHGLAGHPLQNLS